ncbi:MAG: dihydroorotate dehydrogenase electron transfer subunit, partial [Thermoproteota archaeon]|nr:dihydroorotate dehydrogenase electron transfer subunit [Thermoproteota archaeon]
MEKLTSANRLRVTEIKEIKKETSTVKTFTFLDKLCAKAEPGQFLMIWIPGIDEIPMSVSATHPNELVSIAVANVGKATEALHKRKVGKMVGVRGPFGNSFTLNDGDVLIVGGGTGIAPLAFLTEKLVNFSNRVTFLLGAKTQGELLFLKRAEKTLSKIDGKVVAVTEDGGYGRKGLVTEPAEKLLTKERFDMIYTCGPEPMMYKMFLLAEQHKTVFEASLERLMRCAIGLCGSCVIGRFRVCKDGPVFS